MHSFWSWTQTYFFIAEQAPQLCTLVKGEKEGDEVESDLSCSNAGFTFNGGSLIQYISLQSIYWPSIKGVKEGW